MSVIEGTDGEEGEAECESEECEWGTGRKWLPVPGLVSAAIPATDSLTGRDS